jgi:hypothetical protein
MAYELHRCWIKLFLLPVFLCGTQKFSNRHVSGFCRMIGIILMNFSMGCIKFIVVGLVHPSHYPADLQMPGRIEKV